MLKLPEKNVHNINDYIFRELISENPNSTIFRAIRKADNSNVIIKMLKSDYYDHDNIQKINNEFNLINKIKSLYVIKAFELVSIDNGLLLILEDVPGKKLSAVLEEKEWDLLSKIETAIQITEAVADIHHQHIVHKDIKPDNILFDIENKHIKVIDFGIACILSKEILTLNSEQVEGSMSYISPEQTGRMNRPLDYRSDIYSLGVTLYQIFTGKLPFTANSQLELMHKHITLNPIPPKDLDPQIPQALSDIIMKCLAKEADNRYHSAFGLKKDLQKCCELYIRTSEIPDFKPGEMDVYDHFHFPEKLYGRENEINYLNKRVSEISTGSNILLTLSGYSGVGKSSLVNATQILMSQKNGHFAQAKFDQFKRNIPYNGFINIFESLIQQMLTETDENLNEWKGRILEEVGSNGQIIIDVIPSAKLILGNQLPVEDLPPQQNENRFKYVMRSFLKSLLMQTSLVLFLDDLQWADESSIKLIEYFILDSSIKNILFIIAYRDNEIDPFHPLAVSLSYIIEKGGRVVNLPIGPLSQESIRQLIHDNFYGASKQTESLAEIVYKKTEGNPFFSIQFLKYLYEQELFYFDKERGLWTAKLEAINQAKVADNVAELMIRKMKGINKDVLNLLKIGSVIENKFDIRLLSKVSGYSTEKIAELLNDALSENLIVQEKVSLTKGNKLELSFGSQVLYRFVHDRIQQAAYSLLDEEEKKQIHYKVGLAILESTPEDKIQEKCIEISHHLNFKDVSLFNDKEKELLIKLNWLSGLKAKDSISYLISIIYLSKAKECLSADTWEKNYDQTISIYMNLALSLQLVGKIKESEVIFDSCLDKAKSITEKSIIFFQIIVLNTQIEDYDKVFEYGARAMKTFDYSYNFTPSKLTIIKDLIKTKIKLKFYKTDAIENLPIATNEKMKAICHILSALYLPAFVTGKKFLFMNNALTMIDLTLKYGIFKASSPGFISYALVLGSTKFNDFEDCFKYGQSGWRIGQLFPKSNEKPASSIIYYSLVHRWGGNSIKDAITPLRLNFKNCLQVGIINYAATTLLYVNLILFITGEKVSTILSSVEDSLVELSKFTALAEGLSLLIYKKVCLCLQGKEEDNTDPRPEEITDELLAPNNNQNLQYALKYEIWHLFLAFLYGDYKNANAVAKKILLKTDQFPCWLEWNVFYFNYSLSLAAELKSPKDNKDNWKQLLKNYKLIEKWGKASPVNYNHHQLLVKAEIARILDKNVEAVSGYEMAIQAAIQSGYTQDIAIAYELTGKYYKSKNLKELASFHLQKSLFFYNQWGAEGKCIDFTNKYASYLNVNTLSHVHSRDNLAVSKLTDTLTQQNRTIQTQDDELDVNAIIEWSQVFSKEIILEKLMESLMRLMIMVAGADKAYLMLIENGKPYIYSEISSKDKYNFLKVPLLVDRKGDGLSLSIIKYVQRTQEKVLLNDAENEGNFRYDSYILDKHPKSILCMPLLQKGVLEGILYLENTASKEAFTPKIVKLLGLLSSQMTISIENAQFYLKLEGRVNDRTKELKEKNLQLENALDTIKKFQSQLIEQEKLASLGFLASGIAHELKNPLNFVINFSSVLKDEIADFESEIKEKGLVNIDPIAFIHQVKESIQKIDSNSKRADNIINAMQAHSQRRIDQLQKIELKWVLNQAIEQTYSVYAQTNPRLTLSIKYDAQSKDIEAFQGDLTRAIINIIDNSCYALIEKCKKKTDYVPLLEISTLQGESDIKIIIKDNGVGISEDAQKRIFEPFYTTKPSDSGGPGLGLSIAYDIITKEHGGTLIVTSKQDLFTESTITLPLIQGEKK